MLLTLSLGALSFAAPQDTAVDPLTVVSSLPYIADVARHVGGDAPRVRG